jgi:hypothetical protein
MVAEIRQLPPKSRKTGRNLKISADSNLLESGVGPCRIPFYTIGEFFVQALQTPKNTSRKIIFSNK